MPTTRKPFGSLATGEEASTFTLTAGDFEVAMSDFGATLLSFLVPTEEGGTADILLGHESLAQYEVSDAYFGATVGRFANRIAKARFELGGKAYTLAANDGANHLHGGPRGFSRRLWKATPYEEGEGSCLRFELSSPDGEEGYPGRLDVMATYRLFPDGSLDVIYEAESDAETVVNLTQHAYFNLHGDGKGGILDHVLRLEASRYLPVDGGHIPSGGPVPVEGTPFDFREPRRIGDRVEAAGGYDHCYVLDRPDNAFEGELIAFAELEDEESGRSLLASTTMPGVQLYTGNFLAGQKGKNGLAYSKHSGLCLETQFYPDSPNRPDFPSTVLVPGATWSHRTRYSVRI